MFLFGGFGVGTHWYALLIMNIKSATEVSLEDILYPATVNEKKAGLQSTTPCYRALHTDLEVAKVSKKSPLRQNGF